MANLLVHFQPSELVDFVNFIVLLNFKLQDNMFPVLDELIGPLANHIGTMLSQPVTDSEVEREQQDTKKAYLALLNSIIASKSYGVFISERACSRNAVILDTWRSDNDVTGNNASFEPLMQSMAGIAEDVSDTSSQKAALSFLTRCITTWATPANGDAENKPLPGFERFLYERIVPAAFRVPAAPDLNLKDGQVTVVCPSL